MPAFLDRLINRLFHAPSRGLSDNLPNSEDMKLVTRFVGSFLLWGFAVLIGFAIYAAGWAFLGAVLWGLALAIVGMSVGFLFGVPKVLQVGSPSSVLPGESNGRTNSGYRQEVNTNLEEISDWLTKIVVGLGLVQLKNVPQLLIRLSSRVSNSFDGQDTYQSAALAMVIFFTLIGFMFGYLVTRLYLQGALARAESGAADLREIGQKANAALAAAAETVHRRQPTAATATDISSLWDSDPFKNFANGQSESNHRKLTARLIPVVGASTVNRVHLEVYSTDPKFPLDSEVVFHLHPTFPESEIQVQPDRAGIARLDLLSAGAFTVGAETDQGATKLELDLVRVPGGSEEFYNN